MVDVTFISPEAVNDDIEELPVTPKFPPTFIFCATPIPPDVTIEPTVAFNEFVVFATDNIPLEFIADKFASPVTATSPPIFAFVTVNKPVKSISLSVVVPVDVILRAVKSSLTSFVASFCTIPPSMLGNFTSKLDKLLLTRIKPASSVVP